jgi:hypothetical protein
LLTFDDGTASLYSDIYPIMAAAGMRGTAYLIGSLTMAGGRATVPQLRTMYAAGWDLGSHTWGHVRLSRQISSYTRVGTTATVVFAEAHGLAETDSITFAGYDSEEYNGERTVLTAPNSTTITFATAGTNPDTTARGWGYAAKDPALVRSQIRNNREWLLANGWARSADHVAYPYGAWDTSIVPIVRDEYDVKTGRTVSSTNGGSFVLGTDSGVGAPHMLPGFGLDQQTAVAALAKVDEAITAQGTIVLFGHSLVASNPGTSDMLTSEFQALIDGLVTRRDAGQIDVVTISEWYDRL